MSCKCCKCEDGVWVSHSDMEELARTITGVVMRRVFSHEGADMMLSRVGQQAAYHFLNKHGFAVADSELFRQELDHQLAKTFKGQQGA